MFSSAVPQVVLGVLVSISLSSRAEAFVAVPFSPALSPLAMSTLTALGHATPAGRDAAVGDAIPLQTATATTTTTTTGTTVQGLIEVVSHYDSFLVDQWGVMHDGKLAYPGAVECIDRLAEAGKKIVLLSNSSKKKSAALRNLERMGFSMDSILDVVTSGEIAWEGLRQREEEPFKSLGTKCLVFGNGDDDLEYVSSCDCELAEAQDADFILARGSFVVMGSEGTRRHSPTVMTGEGKEETDKAMRVMLQRGAHMLVTNPDFLRPGTNDPMPGLIGKAYAEMGGIVHYVGKPHPAVYEACFKALQENNNAPGTTIAAGKTTVAVDFSSVVAVGDSLPHDILGAQRTGISSVFVAGGVHFEELGVGQGAGDTPGDDVCSAAFLKHLEGGGTPTHVVPAFRW